MNKLSTTPYLRFSGGLFPDGSLMSQDHLFCEEVEFTSGLPVQTLRLVALFKVHKVVMLQNRSLPLDISAHCPVCSTIEKEAWYGSPLLAGF